MLSVTDFEIFVFRFWHILHPLIFFQNGARVLELFLKDAQQQFEQKSQYRPICYLSQISRYLSLDFGTFAPAQIFQNGARVLELFLKDAQKQYEQKSQYRPICYLSQISRYLSLDFGTFCTRSFFSKWSQSLGTFFKRCAITIRTKTSIPPHMPSVTDFEIFVFRFWHILHYLIFFKMELESCNFFKKMRNNNTNKKVNTAPYAICHRFRDICLQILAHFGPAQIFQNGARVLELFLKRCTITIRTKMHVITAPYAICHRFRDICLQILAHF